MSGEGGGGGAPRTQRRAQSGVDAARWSGGGRSSGVRKGGDARAEQVWDEFNANYTREER